jgi:hypothetical protein
VARGLACGKLMHGTVKTITLISGRQPRKVREIVGRLFKYPIHVDRIPEVVRFRSLYINAFA